MEDTLVPSIFFAAEACIIIPVYLRFKTSAGKMDTVVMLADSGGKVKPENQGV
ncbi:MAG: hypothetical protein WD772_02065 [Pseudohongiellaceae bacterium]